MAVTKVGFIGLSATAGWARGAHLPYLLNSPNYEIVALCNSSTDSAKAAIKHYSLPSTTKAYGSPEELASDPEIDLVVCSVRVDRHYPTIVPSLKAGKDVLVEWPLGKSASEARELLKLKNEYGVKTAVVNLQARQAPILHKVKALIVENKIGDVLNSVWNMQAGGLGSTMTEAYSYLTDRSVGGNLVTIHFGHAVDWTQFVLGYGFEDVKALVKNRRTHVDLVDGEGKVIKGNVPKTSDDTIFVQGSLKNGIPLSMTVRGGPAFKGTPGLDWRIYGSKGEIRITSPSPFLNIGDPNMKIELHNHDSDTVEVVEIPKDDLDGGKFEGFASRNTGRVYRELTEGRINCTFEDAVERHEFLEEIYKQNGYLQG